MVLAFATPVLAQNLVPNGSFNSSINGWSAVDPSYASSITWSSLDANGSPASGSLRLSSSASSSTIYARSSSIAVTANISYTLTFAANDQTTASGGIYGAFIGIVIYDASGGYLADYSAGPSQKAVWKTSSITFTTPAQAASVVVFPRIVYGGGSGFGLFDNISLTSNAVPPGATFTANPTSIAAGQSSTLTWTTTNATSVSIDNGVGSEPVNGSTTVSPNATTTYTLTATGSGGTATKQVTVTVNQPPSISFSASPSSITTGQSSTLTWTTTNATSVSIDNGIGAQALSGSFIVNPSSTTTYTLTASGAGGTRTATATVNVGAPGVPQITFSASPSLIAGGGTSTLTWSTSNATSVSLDNGIGVKPLNGSVQVSPTQTTTYKLTATGSGGSQTATTTVTIVAPPTVVFTAAPPAVLPGGSVKLEWQVLDATFVTIDPDLGVQPFAGSITVTPKATTIYVLTATGVGGTRVASVTVVIGGRRRAAKH